MHAHIMYATVTVSHASCMVHAMLSFYMHAYIRSSMTVPLRSVALAFEGAARVQDWKTAAKVVLLSCTCNYL